MVLSSILHHSQQSQTCFFVRFKTRVSCSSNSKRCKRSFPLQATASTSRGLRGRNTPQKDRTSTRVLELKLAAWQDWIHSEQRMRYPSQQILHCTDNNISTSSITSITQTSEDPEDPEDEEDDEYFQFSFQAMFQPILELLSNIFRFLFGWITHIPAWQRHQHLKKLQAASDADPEDPVKHAQLLKCLNKSRPNDVLERVQSGKYKANEDVIVEYLKALVVTDRLAEYAKDTVPDTESDHRSLRRLLHDLERLSGGEAVEMTPGGSKRTPLFISIENGLPKSTSPVGGVLTGFIRLLGTTVFAICLFIWAYAALHRGIVTIPTAGVSSTVKDKAAQNPTVAPKQFVKEELPEKSLKTFKDVKGCPESKEELQDIVEFLKNKDRFTRLGATLPKGVLLTGPPGTGKTLLARAVAGEAGVPFYFRAGSEFEEMFVGVGSRRVRALFNAAKKSAPCIVFIDEIDAIGGSRKNWESQTRKTLNQLLVEMDGFEVNEGVIVMAATNLPETLDAALTRAGRFDRHIHVPLPDVRGRTEILTYYLQDKPISTDVDVEKLAHQTRGFSGAELYNLVNEAALNAAKGAESIITSELLDHARDKIMMGTERKSLVRTEENLRRTAYHESGHALVALNTPGASPLHKATIIARGNALGMVSQTPDKDEYAVSKQQLMARIDVCMGGKVAEELVFGAEHVTTGASSDLQQATATAEHMVMHCGMSEDVGPVFVPNRSSISGDIQKKIDNEVTKILKDAQIRVTKLLGEKMKDLHTLAQALLEQETLTSAEINLLVGSD
eukprot:g1704.t1